MAKQAETLFKEKALKALRKLPFSWWEKIQQVAIRGTPDVLGSLCGTFVAIELKAEKAKADTAREALQNFNLAAIRDTGGIAVVVRPSEWKDFYKELVLYAKNNTPENSHDTGNRGDNH